MLSRSLGLSIALFCLALLGCSASPNHIAIPIYEASVPDVATGDAKGHDGSLATDASADAVEEPPSLDGFTVGAGCNPLAVDPNDCMLPYPSDFLTKPDPTTPTGLRMNLPANSLVVPASSTPIVMTPFNRGDGAPNSAPALVHFGVDVDAKYLAPDTATASSVAAASPIAFFNESTGERVPFLSEMDANGDAGSTRRALIIRPLTPLDYATKYVVVLTNALRDVNGNPLPQSKGFAALRDGITTDVAALESARPHFQTLFSFLAAHGYPKDDLLLAWDYTTASSHTVIGPITVMRQQVFQSTTARAPIPDGGLPDGESPDGESPDAEYDYHDASIKADAAFPIADGGAPSTITYAIDSVTPSPYVDGGSVVEGTFSPPNYLEANNMIDYTSDNTPVLETSIPAPSYPFTLIVPPIAESQPVSLLVFGHGLFGSGRSYLTSEYGNVIQPLAQTLKAAVIATDWIGLSSGDLNLIIQNVAPNLNNVGLVTDRLLQAIVNNLSLIELSQGALGKDPQLGLAAGHAFINPSQIYYYGVSLGGIEGSSFISVSRDITRGVVAVPGASWNNLLARSYDYAQIKAVITLLYPDILLQQEFITLLQSRFDPADPVNLAGLFQKNQLPNSPPSRIAVIQESIDDCQVPNLTTEILARAYGAKQITPDIVPIYGLETVTTPTTSMSLSQFLLESDVAKYVPPTSNLLPTEDNGAHFDLAFTGPALDEVTTLIKTGQIVQTCPDAGACYLP